MRARGNEKKSTLQHTRAQLDEYLFDVSCRLNSEKECHSRKNTSKNTSKNMNADYIKCVASFHCHLD